MLVKPSQPVIDAWESGIRYLGPPRRQRLWVPLTRLDHPRWLWELRRLDSSPPQIDEKPDAQTEIAAVELVALVAGFHRFLLAAIWARAKVSPAMRWCREVRFQRTAQRQ